MGGVPCWIIINCGPLGKAAATLANSKHTPPELVDAATYLAGIEDEICELGHDLAEFLSDAEHAEVIQAGVEADKLRARIFNHLFGVVPMLGDDAKLLTDFAEKQRKFFLGLANKYKTE